MSKFLSCDWGSSSFRLRLVEIPTLAIIAEERSDRGIIQTFEWWKQRGMSEDLRLSFYLDVIHEHIQIFEKNLGTSLHGLPLIISGMACSTIGMIDLPYKELPFAADGSDLISKTIDTGNNFTYKIVAISGAKTTNDVMRGEETQLAGCFETNAGTENLVFIFPGTHSKHVTVHDGKATGIRTFMTGEFFELLSQKSILSVNVERGSGFKDEPDILPFEKGVQQSVNSNLLHNSFLVRTNHLFNRFTRTENYYYLSGLLIGTEINALSREDPNKIILVVDKRLRPYYERALSILNEKSILETRDADHAMVAGHFKILERLHAKNQIG